ncbi:putative metal-dependent enzyme (double-stranded beta helix superfamily) [Amycolatopsis thermophila]|uniref:Metal-dependent enzyme (Double-stranded beta helix superfamily) n=1 Tax=Amycolatopsis thermophila TaxID=206084 RepID=A0ABU0EW49_9PSEU|nr:cysteine dioxygenase family protein [Amycolatopsis thermophila]MDQ0379530.1 putative metal-dependent enzyme (double-stranded beta helix superfamily) [Amycolatopsis thermophila]
MTQSVLRSSEIHPRLIDSPLGELLHPERLLWTPTQLAGLTRTVALELGDAISELLHFDADQRWWARLALTDGIELWVLSWLPGQGTAPHDHGGAAGSFTVLRGELTEEYRYPGGPIRQRTHLAGDGIGFGAGRAHRVTGAGTSPAASIHAYSPPLVPTREYASLDDVPAEIPPLPGILR